MVWSENCMVWGKIVWFQIMNLMVWAGSGVGQSGNELTDFSRSVPKRSWALRSPMPSWLTTVSSPAVRPHVMSVWLSGNTWRFTWPSRPTKSGGPTWGMREGLQCWNCQRTRYGGGKGDFCLCQSIFSPLPIDASHKSYNALDIYLTMLRFVTEMWTWVHISVTKWSIVGYGTGVLWDLCNRSMGITFGVSFTERSQLTSIEFGHGWAITFT